MVYLTIRVYKILKEFLLVFISIILIACILLFLYIRFEYLLFFDRIDVIKELSASIYKEECKNFAPSLPRDASTLWMQENGEFAYYVDLPEHPYLEYMIGYPSVLPKNNDDAASVICELRTDDSVKQFKHPISAQSINQIKWTKYLHKLNNLDKKKAKLTFKLYMNSRSCSGNEAVGFKVSILGKMTKPKKIDPEKSKNTNFNVILIILDAASASHLSSYGYPVKTTPNIDLFAQKSIIFARAYTAAVFTRASMSSLFTSLYTDAHGILKYSDVLPEEAATLPELMKLSGYRTAFFTANGNASERSGLSQGFDDYYDMFRSNPEEMTGKLIDWLRQNKDRPFFLYAHYLLPHPPFKAPYAMRSKFNLTKLPTLKNNKFMQEEVYFGINPHDKEAKAYIITQYDANLYYADSLLKALFDYLFSTDLKNNTLLILTSDHGEAMGEHNVFGHNDDVHIETIWIPLIIYYPLNKKVHKINEVVSTIDIMPTLMDVLNLKGNKGKLQGISFAQCFDDQNCQTERRVFSQSVLLSKTESIAHYAAIDDNFHMLFDHSRKKWEFYNLNLDKTERQNVINNYPVTTAYYKDQILQYIAINKNLNRELALHWQRRKIELSDEEIEHLKALGYLK